MKIKKRNQNLVGKKFNKGHVLSLADVKKHKSYICQCECGNMSVVRASKLISGQSKSCGCLFSSKDITGNVYDRLTVIRKIEDKKYSKYLCRCECGNEKVVYAQSLLNGKTKSCGCLHKELAKQRTGEKAHNWNGGNYPELKAIRNSDQYSEWRSNVFIADSFTCQKCGDNKGGNLHAHHLLSFTRYEDFRFVPENGVTLCKVCHERFHALYGVLKFTDKDYFEFLKNKE